VPVPLPCSWFPKEKSSYLMSSLRPSTERDSASNQTGDTDINLTFDLHDDVESNLEHYVNLARLGDPTEANEYFDEVLKKYKHIFPVFAERSEFLIATGAYEELRKLLPKSQERYSFSNDEWLLVKLCRIISSFHLDEEYSRTWAIIKTDINSQEISDTVPMSSTLVSRGCLILHGKSLINTDTMLRSLSSHSRLPVPTS
jgi:hypothetical protein